MLYICIIINKHLTLMSAFTPAFVKAFTNNCQTLTITDTTNWTNNDENLDKSHYTRSMTLYDINQNVIATQMFGTADFVVFTFQTLSLPQLRLTINFNIDSSGFGSFGLQTTQLLPCLGLPLPL